MEAITTAPTVPATLPLPSAVDDPFPREEIVRRNLATQHTTSFVEIPATLQMIVSGLSLAVVSLNLLIYLVREYGLIKRGELAGNARPGFLTPIEGIMMFTFAFILFSTVFAGAWQMHRMRNWGFALGSSIVALIPLNVCSLFTIPLGIWSIIVLVRKDVRRAFS
jgi:hypothetical protein